MKAGDFVMVGGGILGAVAIAGLLALVAHEENARAREWQAFAAAHSCRVTQRMPSQTFTTVGFGANGQAVIGTGSTSARIAWECDDGVTYWRKQ